MKIQNKIFLVIIPLVAGALIIAGIFMSFSAKRELESLGIRNKSLKAYQLEYHINDQWSILQDSKLEITESYLSIFEKDIISFSAKLIRSNSEIIFAVDKDNIVRASTAGMSIQKTDAVALREAVQKISKENNSITRRWLGSSVAIQEKNFIGYFFIFEPLNWTFFVLESEKDFFSIVNNIIKTIFFILLITIIVSIIVIILFTGSLIAPIKKLISSMHKIIRTNNLKERVPVIYKDEIGILTHTFNVTVADLEKAYKEIRTFAFQSVLAKKQENKIRNIFQKYVPNSVINNLFKDPSRMLVGESKELAILFTDIRGFTTISESYTPTELVAQLNIYFERTVDVIAKNNGIIDKYIGDAIMAFFGAPTAIKNSSLAAVQSAIQMQLAIAQFNKELRKQNKPEFITGIGINYGEVTVGNIGSEHKMDYTVIGDAVNLASRLEGLTKLYKQDVIFSLSACNKIRAIIPCRFIDVVQAKGKTSGEAIFTTVPEFNSKIIDGFSLHNEAMNLYLEKDFVKAKSIFKQVHTLLKDDFLSKMYITRCEQFIDNPPPEEWSGVFVAQTK